MHVAADTGEVLGQEQRPPAHWLNMRVLPLYQTRLQTQPKLLVIV